MDASKAAKLTQVLIENDLPCPEMLLEAWTVLNS